MSGITRALREFIKGNGKPVLDGCSQRKTLRSARATPGRCDSCARSPGRCAAWRLPTARASHGCWFVVIRTRSRMSRLLGLRASCDGDDTTASTVLPPIRGILLARRQRDEPRIGLTIIRSVACAQCNQLRRSGMLRLQSLGMVGFVALSLNLAVGDGRLPRCGRLVPPRGLGLRPPVARQGRGAVLRRVVRRPRCLDRRGAVRPGIAWNDS